MPGDLPVPNAAYTDAEMLSFYMNAVAEILSLGSTNGLRNNLLTRADLAVCQKMVIYYQNRVNARRGIVFNRVRPRRTP